jgi:hypothetical protein
MKRILFGACCVTSALMGCGEQPVPADNGEAATSAVATAGDATYTDPETGGVYLLNPHRRVVLGDGALTAATPRDLPEGVTEVQGAISANGADSDWSGQIQTQVVECASGSSTGSISLACSVSPDYVLVGGGAQDVWSGSGAMLWESRPQDVHNDGAGTTWLASSKDHVNAASHLLHVWAIGLRVRRTDGTTLTHAELKAHISYARIASSNASSPSGNCTVPSGQVAIGGGARSNWQATAGVGQLLTRSMPNGAAAWLAASKDHITADPANVEASCIGIDTNIPGVGGLVVESVSSLQWAGSGVGSVNSSVGISPKSVATCYGGGASWEKGNGRMLFRMSPADGDLRRSTTSSKDHIRADSGYTTAWVMQIRRQ